MNLTEGLMLLGGVLMVEILLVILSITISLKLGEKERNRK